MSNLYLDAKVAGELIAACTELRAQFEAALNSAALPCQLTE